MALAIAYVVFVVVGPVIFLALIRPRPTRRRFALGAASAVGLMVAAMAMLPGGANDVISAIGGLACLWLGWIVTIAMAVQALAIAGGFGRSRKWSAAIGAAATTLPWLGLSLAMTAG